MKLSESMRLIGECREFYENKDTQELEDSYRGLILSWSKMVAKLEAEAEQLAEGMELVPEGTFAKSERVCGFLEKLFDEERILGWELNAALGGE